MPIIPHYYITLEFVGSQKGTCSLIFLNEEKSSCFGCKTKNDLMLAFSGDKFSTYLAYLADVFETLNQLNKKLQGPGSNIIVHTGFWLHNKKMICC